MKISSVFIRTPSLPFRRSELVAQAIARKRSWFTSVAEVVRLRPVMEDQLSCWGVYRSSQQLILDLLEDIDYVLPPAATDDYQVS